VGVRGDQQWDYRMEEMSMSEGGEVSESVLGVGLVRVEVDEKAKRPVVLGRTGTSGSGQRCCVSGGRQEELLRPWFGEFPVVAP
jgi:hypothetical protein